MKNKSFRLISTMLALVMIFSLFLAMPATASISDPLLVTLHPTGAVYDLGQAAVPLKAAFSWPDAYSGSVSNNDPITLQWYWTLDPLVMNEQNGAGSTSIAYNRPLEINAEHTPDTSVVGVKYYYAVVSYTAVPLAGSNYQTKARTNPARVEVISNVQEFTALKLDDKGAPLAGATIRAVSKDGSVVVEVVTGADGLAKFSVPISSYTVTESKAPAGYKGDDRAYYVYAMYEGVVDVENPHPDYPDYQIVFINAPVSTTDVTVLKTDGDGKPLAGATIRISGMTEEGLPRVYDVVTDSNGKAVFKIENGTFDITEYAAPTGYNGTSDKHTITVSANGVFLVVGSNATQYKEVTFVNKPIPELIRDDHIVYMQGYPTGKFLPSRNMTRAEAVVMFYRLMTKKMEVGVDIWAPYYPDMAKTAWYANEVCHLHSLGVLNDYCRDGRFRGNDPVTRAEFATLAAHFDNLEITSGNKFTDVPDDHWAVKYINSAEKKGWIEGYADGTFKPEGNMTRAHVVTLVNRMLDRKGDAEYLDANVATLPKTYPDVTRIHWAYLDIMEASISHNYTRDSAGVEHWTAVFS